MRTPVFTGSCPALATPFDQNGNITVSYTQLTLPTIA